MDIGLGTICRDRVVVFLDLLGFSHSCSQETWGKEGPKKARSDYETLVSMAFGSNSVLSDGQSWEACFALSDSVFLTSAEPGVALFAASTVMHAAYCFSHRRGIQAMIRGGIGYGDIAYGVGITGLDRGVETPGNLYGPAVVEAVRLEGVAPGPRLYCTSRLPIGELGSISSNLLTYAPEINCYEVMWGALSTLKISRVREVFAAAWSAYAKAVTWPPDVRKHYVAGLQFAIRCLSHYYKTPRHRANSSFETDLQRYVHPHVQRIPQMEDWLSVDAVIRWELKEQEQARVEHRLGLYSV
jgi:hypothetical protein